MTIAPHICRTLCLTALQESATLQALARDFTMIETTRVKGRDMAQNIAFPSVIAAQILERSANRLMFAPMFAAFAPQGDRPHDRR